MYVLMCVYMILTMCRLVYVLLVFIYVNMYHTYIITMLPYPPYLPWATIDMFSGQARRCQPRTLCPPGGWSACRQPKKARNDTYGSCSVEWVVYKSIRCYCCYCGCCPERYRRQSVKEKNSDKKLEILTYIHTYIHSKILQNTYIHTYIHTYTLHKYFNKYILSKIVYT